ncbi:MAG: hypothetical protein ACOYM3_09805 [Terrimicrobiaceae bacterium]
MTAGSLTRNVRRDFYRGTGFRALEVDMDDFIADQLAVADREKFLPAEYGL